MESFDASAHVDRFLRERGLAGVRGAVVAQARAALTPVFVDAAARLIRKESNALARALKQHAANAKAFGQWAADFYARLAEDAQEVFAAPLEAARQLAPACVAPDVKGAVASWTGRGPDWAAYCRNVANGDEGRRSRTLAHLVLDLVLPEPEPVHA